MTLPLIRSLAKLNLIWYLAIRYPNIISAHQICFFNATEGFRLSVEETRTIMMDAFEATCEDNCITTNIPGENYVSRNYTDFMNLRLPVNIYDQYTTSCANVGYTTCLVSSTLKINVPEQPALNTPAGILIIEEINKPLCFPNSCEESQVAELNPYDSRCSLAQNVGETCNIISSSAKCPDDRVVVGETFNCPLDNPSLFSQQTRRKNALYALMEGQCVDESTDIGPNTARFCDTTSQPGVISSVNSYSDFVAMSDTFGAYHEDCAASNGAVCLVSFELDFIPLSVSISPIKLRFEHTDYPICVPKGCQDHEDLVYENILQDMSGTEVGINLCDASSDSCNYRMTNFECFPDPAGDGTEQGNEKEEITESIKEVIDEGDDEEEERIPKSESTAFESTTTSSVMSANLYFVKYLTSIIFIGLSAGV